MTQKTYTPEQKAAYKIMRAAEQKSNDLRLASENLARAALALKKAGDITSLDAIIPIMQKTQESRSAAKSAREEARAAYYLTLSKDVTVETPSALTQEEAATFEALMSGINLTEEGDGDE